MTAPTRTDIVALLHGCGVFTLREYAIEDKFLAGDVDFAIADLQMDSLSAMEFCIALEDRWSLSVSPTEIDRLGSLGDLLARLAGA